MKENKFNLIYGKFTGIEKRAVEFLTGHFPGNDDYVMPCADAKSVWENDLKNAVIVGTTESNVILKDLADKGFFHLPEKEQGYTVKIGENPYDSDSKFIVICGFDDEGTLYGAMDFIEHTIPYLDTLDSQQRYPEKEFKNEFFKDYEVTESPSVKMRGIWTWGHVIYDYKKYIENMAHLKMNTLILWNDYVPINIKDIIDESHSYGIKIYLGFSWGWNEARVENGGLDISDERKLSEIQESIVDNYKKNYKDLDIDGIYFQSFTEFKEDKINDVVIAERVVKFVNDTAQAVLCENPELMIMFGLHATSVSNKLEYIKKTDDRIMIVWEDAGAFPYAYTPRVIEDYEETCEFSKQIASLRNTNELFGVVSKGLTCLDWWTFSHMDGKFVMGKKSSEFIEKRAREKEMLWKYVDAYWQKNAEYAYGVFKILKESNKDAMITALIEDGMFEAEIHHGAALYAEMLWNTESSVDELILRTSLRADVK